jgi:hypothetical protein
MTFMPKVTRRSFIISTAAAGSGLALGLQLPFGPKVVRAADGSPEIGAWVVIRPDDTVVIRVARSEMGQGTITGLAQLVAEELECDWAKVTTEYPTPGQNLARKRVWGSYSTGGSRGNPRVQRIRPQGRRNCARDADPGGGEPMGRPRCGMHRVEQRHHAQGFRDARQRSARSPSGAKLEPPKK